MRSLGLQPIKMKLKIRSGETQPHPTRSVLPGLSSSGRVQAGRLLAPGRLYPAGLFLLVCCFSRPGSSNRSVFPGPVHALVLCPVSPGYAPRFFLPGRPDALIRLFPSGFTNPDLSTRSGHLQHKPNDRVPVPGSVIPDWTTSIHLSFSRPAVSTRLSLPGHPDMLQVN